MAVRRKSGWRWCLAMLVLWGAPREAAPSAGPAAEGPLLERGDARVILVGDSITGLSRNYKAGFAHQMDWALEAVYPGCRPDLVALGGSGQTIASWLNVEKLSRTEERTLDARGIGVKASLDRPARVLVIMLGMNDVLAPTVADDRGSLDQWVANYRLLIAALRGRVHPATVALATITPNTEDPASPKNRIIGQMNERITALAEELGCRLLGTGETVHEVLRAGRRLRPDFHVTYDFVHPNEAGHLAIAMAMLRGLGEPEAARRLAEVRLAALLQKTAGDGPVLSYRLTPREGPLDSDRQAFRVHYWWTPKPGSAGRTVSVSLAGAGWQVTPVRSTGAEGEFLATGAVERRETVLRLQATDGAETAARDVKISAPWLVATGLVQPLWSGMKFDPAMARTPLDDAIREGRDFVAPLDLGKGRRLRWQRTFPSVDYTGLDAPGSLDFAAVTHAGNFETGYAARWIYSPGARPVRVALGVQAFAGALYLSVFLNGQELYAGQITAEPRKQKQLEARLRQGWNTLAFKANHCTWQWQCAVDLLPAGEESLADLRYSTVPRPAGSGEK
jgi:lysophospholipase L1-like esterase